MCVFWFLLCGGIWCCNGWVVWCLVDDVGWWVLVCEVCGEVCEYDVVYCFVCFVCGVCVVWLYDDVVEFE